MINLKKLLTKITQQLNDLVEKQYFLEEATWWGSSTKTTSDYRTFHNLATYLNGSGTDTIYTTSSDCFTRTSTGIQVKKTGYYFISVAGYATCNSTSARIATKIYNPVNKAVGCPSRYFAGVSGVGWMPFSNSGICLYKANEIITPQIEKYSPNDTTTTVRVTSFITSVIYLGPAQAYTTTAMITSSAASANVTWTDDNGITWAIARGANSSSGMPVYIEIMDPGEATNVSINSVTDSMNLTWTINEFCSFASSNATSINISGDNVTITYYI